MSSIRSYRELKVWQESMDLSVRIYEITSRFPPEEKYGLTSQMRRAAVSISANIAEGQARRTTGEFLHLLGIARGSLAELETFLALSERLGLAPRKIGESWLPDCAEINNMLTGLMRSLSTKH